MFYKILLSLICFFAFSIASVDIKQLDTFQGQFNQIITSSTGKNIEYKGDVFIKKSGKILWKYKTPIEKNVFVLNDYAIIDEPELEQAIYTQLQSEINIIKLIQNAKELGQNKYIASLDGVDYIIEVSSQTKKIKNIVYTDKLENSVVINFTNTLENKEIDDSIFKFTAPDYYDIIRK